MQKEQLKHLKEFEKLFQVNVESVHHMKYNIPPHIPKKRGPVSGNEGGINHKQAADVQQDQAENIKQTSRNSVRDMEYVTVPEFESIPQYMKGRVTYDQLNIVVDSFNAALKAKYKILSQPVKILSNHSRKLQQRFKTQETKDTKGRCFIVEEDIREFTQMKVDKRCQGILSMLRHCQRLRELRGGGLVRYVLL
ncbi:LOW QUALITY PROTEIN: spindle and kinetochore-associated protein 1 [Nematolebias whitei]|uniref:LOW QUALITY PROTEIN: spindle and kinetochore-associated protein 1 n=1 Tax=Nematolebias whitei TaxID=451745 RepID=UPI00189C2434|nr:LOW QUALITY PROTEIN: spindle and kinetochore-associated protein 1 [Nematolebias whitei]